MKSVLPFCTFVVLLASCTTAYKSGHTPDDVYFSPSRPQAEYVRTEDRSDKYRYNEQSDDDRYLRMKVRNRRTWSDLDYYYSDPYAYNYNGYYNNYNSLYYNTPWNSYSSWNYYYNPYSSYYNYCRPVYGHYGGTKVVVVAPAPPVYNHPRAFNLNVYNPQNNDPKRTGSRRVYSGDNSSYNYNSGNSNTSSNNTGSRLRNIFSNSNSSNNNNSSYSAPSRSERSSSSTTPSSSSGRSSSSSTNAPVRKF